MDDEPNPVPEISRGETIPMASSEPAYERIETPLDETSPILGYREAAEPPEDLHPEEKQFSLRGLMILFTVTCCVLGVGARLRIDIFAGMLGFLTLVTAGLMSMLDARRAIIHLSWWILLGSYILTCVAAVMRS